MPTKGKKLQKRVIARLRSFAQQYVGRPLVRWGITANQVTVAGAVVCAIGSVIWMCQTLYYPLFWWGLAVFLLGALGDWFDGAVARAEGKPAGGFGNVADSWTDRAVEGAMFGALAWVLMHQHHYLAAYGCIAALTGSFLVSYGRERAEKLGVGGEVGFGSRLVRMAVLGLGVIAGHWIGYIPAVLVINLVAWQTAIQRLLHIRVQLVQKGTP